MKSYKSKFWGNRKMLITPILSIIVLTFLSFLPNPHQKKPAWKAPKEADNLKNPFATDKAAIAEGKALYDTYCSVCHGVKGKGDGPGGMALEPRPGNFTKAEFHAQTDGAVFWKLTEGRAPMASYKELMNEDQRWQLVSYLKTLK